MIGREYDSALTAAQRFVIKSSLSGTNIPSHREKKLLTQPAML